MMLKILILAIPPLLILIGVVYLFLVKYEVVYLNGKKIHLTEGFSIYTIGNRVMIGKAIASVLSKEELLSLYYHEEGHIKKKHSLLNSVYLSLIYSFFCFMFINTSSFAGITAIVIYVVLIALLYISNNKLQEYIADNYAAKRIDKDTLIAALTKLHTNNFNLTHPTLKQRIYNLG